MVDNNQFQIYRSERLGKSGVKDLFRSLDKLGLKRPKTIIYMNYMDYSFLFKHALEEYQIQEKYGYEFYHSYNLKYRTYLDGKNPYHPIKDIDDVENLSFWSKPTKESINLFSIVRDGKKDGGVEAFHRIMKIVLDAKRQPVLFHCHGGVHRTGMIALAVRYIQGGEWTKKINNPVHVKDIIADNKAKLEYLYFNPQMPREENIQFIDQVIKTERFQQMIKDYRNRL